VIQRGGVKGKRGKWDKGRDLYDHNGRQSEPTGLGVGSRRKLRKAGKVGESTG